jgi:hypothetical protein
MQPVVSAVLVMAFSIAIVGMVVSFGLPLVEEKTQQMKFESGCGETDKLAYLALDVSDDPIGSSKAVRVDLGRGQARFSENLLIYRLDGFEYTLNFGETKFNTIEITGKKQVQITKTSGRELHVNIE